jgi:hypothetical protein
MNAKQKILKKVSEVKDEGYANACQLWKGHGEMGQAPHGWWLKPFNENARFIGSTVKEAVESFEDYE